MAIGRMMSLRQWHWWLHLRERTEQRRISLRRPSLDVGMPSMDGARGKGTGYERTQSASSEHLNARSVTPARDKNPQTPAFHHEPGRGMSAKASHCSNPTVILVRSVLSSSTVCNTTARWIVRFSDLVVILPERRRNKAISNLSAGVWVVKFSGEWLQFTWPILYTHGTFELLAVSPC